MILEIIQSYTREAGVRGLERELSKLMRKTVTEIMLNNRKKISISNKEIKEAGGDYTTLLRLKKKINI